MKGIITILTLLISSIGFADTNFNSISKVTKTVPIVDFEFNEDTNIATALVKYNNSCYRPWAQVKGVVERNQKDRLVLTHLAEYSTNAVCLQAISHEWVTFDLSNVPVGDYKIVDGHNGNFLEFTNFE